MTTPQKREETFLQMKYLIIGLLAFLMLNYFLCTVVYIV